MARKIVETIAPKAMAMISLAFTVPTPREGSTMVALAQPMHSARPESRMASRGGLYPMNRSAWDAATFTLDVLPASRLDVIAADDLFDLTCRAASIIDQDDLTFL
jgi:hypothetical protein